MLLLFAVDISAQKQSASLSDIYHHNKLLMRDITIRCSLESKIEGRPYLCIICAHAWGIVIDNGESYRLYYDRHHTSWSYYSYQDISKKNSLMNGLFSALNADIGSRTTLSMAQYNPFTEFIIAQSGSTTPIYSQSGYKFVFRHSDNQKTNVEEFQQEKNLTEGISAILAYIIGYEHPLLHPDPLQERGSEQNLPQLFHQNSFGNFTNGKKTGKWLYFDDHGKLIKHIEYK